MNITIELQSTIILVALIAGGIRGIVGYYLNAPPTETFNPRKLLKTLIKYAVINLLAVNASTSIGGVTWTVIGVIVFSVILLAQDVGIDIYSFFKTN